MNLCDTTSPVRFKHDFEKNHAPHIIENGTHSNVAFRIAYFLWIMRGSNELEPLEYYSEHVCALSDNDIHLRGAYGPRMLYWVGADQLQEAMDKNSDIEEIQDYVKPQGVNQLQSVYNDLNDGMITSTIVIRDPSIDFEVSEDVPDLISVTFNLQGGKLRCILNYESISLFSNYINDVWCFIRITEMLRTWLLASSASIEVVSAVASNDIHSALNEEGFGQMFEVRGKKYNTQFHPDPNECFADIEKLQSFERHLRQRMKGTSFINPAVSVADMRDEMFRCFTDTMSSDYCKQLSYVLMIFAMAKYDFDNHEEFILEYYKKIAHPGLKEEIGNYLLTANTSLDNELARLLVYGTEQK